MRYTWLKIKQDMLALLLCCNRKVWLKHMESFHPIALQNGFTS